MQRTLSAKVKQSVHANSSIFTEFDLKPLWKVHNQRPQTTQNNREQQIMKKEEKIFKNQNVKKHLKTAKASIRQKNQQEQLLQTQTPQVLNYFGEFKINRTQSGNTYVRSKFLKTPKYLPNAKFSNEYQKNLFSSRNSLTTESASQLVQQNYSQYSLENGLLLQTIEKFKQNQSNNDILQETKMKSSKFFHPTQLKQNSHAQQLSIQQQLLKSKQEREFKQFLDETPDYKFLYGHNDIRNHIYKNVEQPIKSLKITDIKFEDSKSGLNNNNNDLRNNMQQMNILNQYNTPFNIYEYKKQQSKQNNNNNKKQQQQQSLGITQKQYFHANYQSQNTLKRLLSQKDDNITNQSNNYRVTSKTALSQSRHKLKSESSKILKSQNLFTENIIQKSPYINLQDQNNSQQLATNNTLLSPQNQFSQQKLQDINSGNQNQNFNNYQISENQQEDKIKSSMDQEDLLIQQSSFNLIQNIQDISKTSSSKLNNQKQEKQENLDQILESYKKKKQIIVQTDLDNDSTQHPNIQKNVEIVTQILNIISKLNNEFQSIIDLRIYLFSKKELFEPYLSIHESVLSAEKVNFIIQQYQITDKRQIDWAGIDQCCKPLRFFQKYSNTIRVNLLKVSKLKEFKAGQIVFRQDDNGDQMYIILQGSVNVRAQQIIGNYTESHIVNVLYDGQHFGELSMMNTSSKREDQKFEIKDMHAKSLEFIRKNLKLHEKIADFEIELRRKGYRQEEREILIQELQKKLEDTENVQNNIKQNGTQKKSQQQLSGNTRSATIEIAENSLILSIEKDDFQKVLMEMMQDELDIKIKLLNTLHFLDHFQPFALIPIANLLKVEKYAINDMIILQGQKIQKFYIVSRGRLKIVRICTLIRDQQHSDYAVRFKKRPNPMHFNKEEIKKTTEDANKSENLLLQTNVQIDNLGDSSDQNFIHLRPPHLEDANQVFDYTVRSHNTKGEIKYDKFEEFGNFTIGDYFGQRALTGKILKNRKTTSSQLTIIADTQDVELYTIKKEQLEYLPEFLKHYILSIFEDSKDFDDFDLDNEKDKVQYWDNFKTAFYKEQLKQQTIERGKPEFKEY